MIQIHHLVQTEKLSRLALKLTAGIVTTLFFIQSTTADIVDFDGLEVEIMVDVTSDGGQNFFATLSGSNTSTIGAGHEFTINVGASGFSTRPIRVDFDEFGLVNVFADSQFSVGNTAFSDFSFDISVNLSDAEITSAISSGSMVRGSASTSGLDPVVWTFINESDNSFGKVMTFGEQGGTTPKVQLAASAVPEPSSFFAGLGIVTMAAFRRKRRRG